MKSLVMLGVGLVAFAATAEDAARAATLIAVAFLDVAIVAHAMGVRRG